MRPDDFAHHRNPGREEAAGRDGVAQASPALSRVQAHEENEGPNVSAIGRPVPATSSRRSVKLVGHTSSGMPAPPRAVSDGPRIVRGACGGQGGAVITLEARVPRTVVSRCCGDGHPAGIENTQCGGDHSEGAPVRGTIVALESCPCAAGRPCRLAPGADGHLAGNPPSRTVRSTLVPAGAGADRHRRGDAFITRTVITRTVITGRVSAGRGRSSRCW